MAADRGHPQIAWAKLHAVRRRAYREQGVVELNSKVPVRRDEEQRARKSRSKSLIRDFRLEQCQR
jgi:hypothetical protein